MIQQIVRPVMFAAGIGAFLFSAGALGLSGEARADTTECAVKYERTACPGQEAISFKKCDGSATCVKYKKADSLASCQAAATKSCRNRRLNITKLKVITATWQGQAIQTASGKDDFCLEYPKRNEEFNHCDK